VSRQRPQYSGDWKTRRRITLERDGHECQLRMPGCLGEATTVDHIVPVALGGDQALDNLQAACLRCNSAKGDGRRGRSSGRQVTLPAARFSPSPRSRTAKVTHYELGGDR
jgi:5-methylcytosine-specific restriction enzyme A